MNQRKIKIGLYFGSFNPITKGHVEVARAAIENTDIEGVWFVVSPENPDKAHTGELEEAKHRLKMVRLAISDEPNFYVSKVEFNMPRPSYTVDTLVKLREMYKDFDFYIIAGSDTQIGMDAWGGVEDILDNHKIIVHPRDLSDSSLQPSERIHKSSIYINDVSSVGISATQVRALIKSGDSTSEFVNPAVENYIKENGLFGTPESTKILSYSDLTIGLVDWISDYANRSGQKGFTLGVSGGVDSAVVSTLAAKTGLPVLILEMPIHQSSSETSRAKNHIIWLKRNFDNVKSIEIDLTNTYDLLYSEFHASKEAFSIIPSTESFDFSMANTRSRLRMTTLYQFAGMHKLLVVGTGNKIEDFGIGFFTKFGDGGVDLSPIGDLLKSEVCALGKFLGVDEGILLASPTDGLHEDERTDEMQIGATYDELEWAMGFTEKQSKDELTERQLVVIEIYNKLNSANQHKMSMPPIFNSNKFRK